MFIPNTIQDRQSAGDAWLKRRVELDEVNMPDYERPLKEIKRTDKSPFEKDIARVGFMSACFRRIAP